MNFDFLVNRFVGAIMIGANMVRYKHTTVWLFVKNPECDVTYFYDFRKNTNLRKFAIFRRLKILYIKLMTQETIVRKHTRNQLVLFFPSRGVICL